MKIRNPLSRAQAAGTVALLLLPLAAAAQTTNVFRPIEAGQADLMSVPLLADGGNAISNVFAAAADGSIIYLWDMDLQNWTPSQKTAKDWPGSDRILEPGQSFFFAPASAQTVVLTGTPLDFSFAYMVPARKSMLAVPFPETGIWGHCQLSWLLPPGSTVAFWDRPNQTWLGPYTNAPDGRWEAAAFHHLLLVGDGFAVEQPPGSSEFGWTQFEFTPPPAQTATVVRTAGSNQWDLMSVPLHTASGNVFGAFETNAPAGTQVLFYDAALANFSGGTKSTKGWDTPTANRVVLPGESFFLKSPAADGLSLALTGTVPGSSVTNPVNERWTALGYPYPDAVAWTDTALASNLPNGSLVYFWDGDRQRYDVFRKGPPVRGGWGAASNHVVLPGDGFLVRQPPGSAPFPWVQERGN